MKIKLLIKKIKYKIVKFLYNYFKKIYIRNINIDDNEILQYAHNELTIYGYNKDSKYYNDIIEVIAAISKNNNINSSIKHNISVINKLCDKVPITPLTLKEDEFQLIDSKGTCQNKRKSSIFKDPDGSIHDIDAFSKKPVGTYRFDTKTWEKNDKCITWNGGLFEHKDNVLTGRYFGICNIWNYETDKGYMPKPKRIILCVEVEISPDNWIMAVSADSTELLLLNYDYNIKWEQVSCLKGIRLEDVTPELDSKAYAELKNNKH